MPNRLKTLSILTGSVLFLASSGWAGEENRTFNLTDGQIIHGQVLEENEEFILVESPTLGRVEIPRSALRLDAPDRLEGATSDPALMGIEDILSLSEEEEAGGLFRHIRGTIEAGYLLQSGRTDRDEITLRADLQQDLGRNNYRFQSEFLYGTQNDEKNNDRYGLNFRWRRTLSERFFTQTLTTYEKDRIRLVRHRAEQEVGIGYKWINRDDFKLSFGPGLTFQFEEFRLEEDQEPVDDSWNYLLTVNQDLLWLINSRLRVEQSTKYLLDPDDTEDYIIRFNSALISKLTDQLSLSVRYQLLYENQTAPNVERADQRLMTTLGWAF